MTFALRNVSFDQEWTSARPLPSVIETVTMPLIGPRGEAMRRRDFIKTLVGAASLGLSFAAPAQTAERVRPAIGARNRSAASQNWG
jgi:hypothetical protein